MKAEKVLTKQTVTDPVCGMRIDPAAAAGKADYKSETFHFCSKNCLETFRREPEKFANKSGAGAGEANETATGLTGVDVASGARHDHSTPSGKGERVDLPITGMTCAACANRIESSSTSKPVYSPLRSISPAPARPSITTRPRPASAI